VRRSSTTVLAALAVGWLVLTGGAGCGSAEPGTAERTTERGSGGTDQVTGTITVFAAASLTEVFTGLGREFERAHPGVTVRFSFGPSSGLAEQIAQGAPADLFASAGPAPIKTVVDSGDLTGPQPFATNSLQIAVPRGNPARIAAVTDLARPGLKVAVCQTQVPCGEAAAKVLAKVGARVTPVTEEVDVKAVLAKVRLGEVDAGMVYVTDVRAAAGAVDGVPIPAADNASSAYLVGTVAKSSNAAAATAFVRLLLSGQGRSALTGAGFGPP
jgi:molybdate transport system substrate-binding protein